MKLLPIITINLIFESEFYTYNMESKRWADLLITPNRKVSVKFVNPGLVIVETNTKSVKSFFKMLFRKNSLSEENN